MRRLVFTTFADFPRIRGGLFGQALRFLVRVKLKRTMPKHKKPDESLKGWAAIAKFLGQPTPTVQRWATEGMPLTRIGRYVAASPAELEGWLTLN